MPAKTPTAIESVEEINLNGISQTIYLTGQDIQKPILLILHGGPGESILQMWHQHPDLRELEAHFLVVNWDQRGAGKSYSDNIPVDSMTLLQLIKDAHALTQALKQRFKQDQIYLLAHSAGTMIAIPLIQKYPEDFYAYIGVGQVISFAKNEREGYLFALEQAQKKHNQDALSELREAGEPDEKGNYPDDEEEVDEADEDYDPYEITEKWVTEFGGSFHNTKCLAEYDVLITNSYEKDRQKWEAGLAFSQQLFRDKHFPNMKEFDIQELVTEFYIPVYFVSGKYDYETPVHLVRQYFTEVETQKDITFIEFEHSAHFPFLEEPRSFNYLLINKVLPETYDPVPSEKLHH